VPAAIRTLDELQRNLLKKAIGPGLEKASQYLADIEKENAPTGAGILRQSIGSTKAKLYPASFCGYVASGPRRGYARAVQVVTNPKGVSRLKRLSKKATLTTPTSAPIKNPAVYARFLKHGRKAISARGQRGAIMLLQAGGGTFFRHGVRAAPPRDFMRPAENQTGRAQEIATEEINTRLQELLSK
jgi:hypothetical protein